MAHRITLIHAVEVAIPPIRDAFAKLWPEADVYHLLDDSLSADLSAAGSLTDPIKERIRTLAAYAMDTGSDGILFTCSAFGDAIEQARQGAAVPVLKPNEAMFEAALDIGSNIAMLATFAPSVPSMEAEFYEQAQRRGASAKIRSIVVPAAMAALKDGDADTHNKLLADASANLKGYDAVLLAHFSTAQASNAVADVLDAPILTSPQSAVAALSRLVNVCAVSP